MLLAYCYYRHHHYYLFIVCRITVNGFTDPLLRGKELMTSIWRRGDFNILQHRNRLSYHDKTWQGGHN